MAISCTVGPSADPHGDRPREWAYMTPWDLALGRGLERLGSPGATPSAVRISASPKILYLFSRESWGLS